MTRQLPPSYFWKKIAAASPLIPPPTATRSYISPVSMALAIRCSMSHGCQEVASANPQQRDRDPGDKGRAQAKRAVGTWQGRWDDVLGVVYCRVQQHDQKQAPIGARIEPRHGDGQRGHLQHVHEERLSKGVGLGNEELRQVPAGPNDAEQDTGARQP